MSVSSRKFCITSVGGGSLNDYRRAAGRLVAVAGQQASRPLVDGVCQAMECAASLSAMITGGRLLMITAILVSTPVPWLSDSTGSLYSLLLLGC
jgi:hypothetical protein